MQLKRTAIRIVFFLSLLFLGACIGYFIGKVLKGSPVFDLPIRQIEWPAGIQFILIALILPIFIFVIGWHEGGHAFAGRFVGFDFRMFVVGPLKWEKQQNGWQFSWNRNLNTAGGMVLCMPTDSIALSRKFTIYALGGPLASLLLVIVASCTFYVLQQNDLILGVGMAVLAATLLVTALLSFFIFLATAIPMRMGGFYTDGARVLRLIRGGDVAQFDVFVLKMIAQSASGLRPKRFDVQELEAALALATKIKAPFGVYLHHYLHQAAFDAGDLEKAEAHLLRYIENIDNIPAGFQSSVWVDAAFFYAFGKKDLNQATHFWQQYKPSPIVPKAQVFATEAAIHLLNQTPQIALEKIEAARKELPNMIDKSVANALAEKLGIMEQMM